MAEKAIRLGGEATADAIVSAVDTMYSEHTFNEKDFALKHNDAEIAMDSNFAAQSFWKDVRVRFFRKKSAVLGLILVVFIVLLAAFGPGMNEYTYSGQELSQKNFAPRVQVLENFGIFNGDEKMSTTTGSKMVNAYVEKGKEDVYYWFGSDTYGRDIWTRTWEGARVSLIIAVAAAIIDMVIGMSYGLISGYFGGKVDMMMQRFLEVANGIPRLVIVTLLLLVLKPGMITIIFALMLTEWVGMSRIARAEMLKLKDQEFVLASRTLGAGSFFIIFKEVLPNIIGPSDSGETAVVSDYVAQKTQETWETLAAVDTRFKALGGELTAEQLSTADRYAQQMMDQYGDTYTANGIGLETVKAYERLQVEHTALLDMVYGPDGETPVEDDELTSHLDDSMYEICYISIPLYNTSTYAFANDDQKTKMLRLAQTAADSVNTAGGETVSDQVSALHEAAQNALPDIYAVLDSETSDDSASVQTELLTESDVASAFTQDGAADALRSLSYGEAAAVQINSYTLLLMVRVDPLSVSSLDDLRSQILSDMKGGELDDALAAGGAELAHDLDSSAMNKLPAKKIVNNSANN